MSESLPPPTPAAPESAAPAEGDDLTGRTLGEFRLLRRLGAGGMGQVYLAEQSSLKRKVAIKLLKTEFAANATALQRFRQEAEAVARVTHANIVQVHAVGESDGLHYMALEYVEGRNLRDYLGRKGPPELSVALSIMRQVAAALQRAGELGVVHRDIKPENVLVTRKGEVKVADFGLSRCLGGEDQPLNITQSGVTLGTPLYMSPEQVQGKPLDPRSDIYSFGVTCFHLLTGRPPFGGATAFEVALQHVQAEPPSLEAARPDLPPELCRLVQRMMAKSPEARPQNGREVLRELSRIRDGLSTPVATQPPLSGAVAALDGVASAPLPTVTPRRQWPRVAAVVVLFAAAASAGAWVRMRQGTPEAPAATVTEAAKLTVPEHGDEEQRLLDEARRGRDRLAVLGGKRNAPGLPEHVRLIAYYLDRGRDMPTYLDKAEAYCKSLDQKGNSAPLQAVGHLGLAVAAAYRDRADDSVKLFVELGNRPREERLLKGQLFPLLLGSSELGPHVREALYRDEVNLRPKPLPAELDYLKVKPRVPPARP
jgi:hypothetical protein